MKRLDVITANTLVQGDRFYFPSDKSKIAYQMTDATNKEVRFNIIHQNGKRTFTFDRVMHPEKQVIFLRHKEAIA